MFIYKLTPGFTDTDALGHINNTRLPVWFELARNDVFRLFTPDLDPKKWQLILARIEVDFVGELFYGENVEIKTFIERIGKSSFTVGQEAWQGGTLGAKGQATLVHYSFEQKKPQVLEGELRKSLEAHLRPQDA
ncbi:acyl-CoA thioester hydrolase [Marinospirillum celere]|uniref:Acyl-CoA thioester hydrolase n=1 Tax=Marinospirillum celere TaxID=1122252 RepID=A0A1I1JS93_9GAMM|nr:thioesterase family protein [Marinospirillum celere]SFC51529.1 acyl-CoA thioester hydrolase [Marinospirillum celere]